MLLPCMKSVQWLMCLEMSNTASYTIYIYSISSSHYSVEIVFYNVALI